MKYYLVARTACVMVGIEQCRGYIVGRALQAAFEKEFAGRILIITAGAVTLPSISFTVYEGPPGLFHFMSDTSSFPGWFSSHSLPT